MAQGHLMQSSKQSAMNIVFHNKYIILIVGGSMSHRLASVAAFSPIS